MADSETVATVASCLDAHNADLRVEDNNMIINESSDVNLTENNGPIDPETVQQSDGTKMSKKQMKRLLRNKKWIESKGERKQREKAKRKEKLAKLKQSGEKLVSRAELKAKLVKMADSLCRVRLVIDCDYAQYMNELEMKKLCKQLNRCYSMNKHSTKPAQLYITSINGTVKQMMEKYQPGYTNWDAFCTEQHWKELFLVSDQTDSSLKSNVVYLSGDSPVLIPDCSQIQQLNANVFIIGGLIDHNRHKGLALERATEIGVSHGQLPIGEYIKMAHRKILAIPHVFEIMLYASNGTLGQLWNDIFRKVIPMRKLDHNDEQKSNIDFNENVEIDKNIDQPEQITCSNQT